MFVIGCFVAGVVLSVAARYLRIALGLAEGGE